MAGSPVDICNVALGHIGVSKSISSLDERSTEARECNRFYNTARRRVLREADWSFARSYGALSQVLNVKPVPPFSIVYAFPREAVAFRRIVAAKNQEKIKFSITSGAANQKLIHTDKAGALGIWTVDLTDPTQFDPSFEDALAWALAGDLAMPLTKSQQKADRAYSMAQVRWSKAEEVGGNEESFKLDSIEQAAEWIRARI